jgi:hypothetical protein
MTGFKRAVLGGVLLLAGVVGLHTAARAEERERLSQKAAQKVLLGFDLSGTVAPSGTPWRECIAPDGQTVFQHAGRTEVGRVQIGADNRVCFSYASQSYARQHCFFAERVNGQLRLSEADGGPTLYRVQRATAVSACRGDGALS